MAVALHYALEDLEAEGKYTTERLWELFCTHLGIMVGLYQEGL